VMAKNSAMTTSVLFNGFVNIGVALRLEVCVVSACLNSPPFNGGRTQAEEPGTRSCAPPKPKAPYLASQVLKRSFNSSWLLAQNS
jgi:hypothetical protein